MKTRIKIRSRLITFGLLCITFPFSLLAMAHARYLMNLQEDKEEGKGMYKKVKEYKELDKICQSIRNNKEQKSLLIQIVDGTVVIKTGTQTYNAPQHLTLQEVSEYMNKYI
jgi:hypothetical protein